MRRSAETESAGPMDGRQVAGEEEEAVRKLRVALRNPHGTSSENRERVFSAWQTLCSVATSPDVQIKSRKRQRKRNRLEEKAEKKKKNGPDKKSESGSANSLSADSMREEDKMLHEAAQLGQTDRVRELVSQGSKVTSKNNSGYSALHWASLYGHVEVVRALLTLGAGDGKRINRQNDVGNTALHLACLGHHARVAVMLQIYKPDEYILNAYDQSPISLGLRDLVSSVEKTQQLDNFQAARANSHLQHLLSESLDWRMGRDSDSAATSASDIMTEKDVGNGPGRVAGGAWEDYDSAWKMFVEKFTVTSGAEDGAARSKSFSIESLRAHTLPVYDIRFQDVPWPFSRSNVLTGNQIFGDGTQGQKGLVLAELGLTGATLRPLIQRERLRWHPDKFVQLFGRHLALEDKSAILAGVQTVCQLLNSLADSTEELGE